METMTWTGVAALVIAALLAVGLIILLKRGLITRDTITASGALLDSLPVFSEDGFTAQLFNYARMAVRAVEQMTKSGLIPKDNEIRKTEAFEQIETYAKLDGLDLGIADRDAIDTLIEAAVLELPPSE